MSGRPFIYSSALLLGACLAACGPPAQLRMPEFTYDEGVVILARLPEEGPDGALQRMRHSGNRGVGTHYIFVDGMNHVSRWPDVLNAFHTDVARMEEKTKLANTPVWVVRGGDQVFYGRMAVFGTEPNARGPAARSYRLTVPAKYFGMASDGRISVVYETYAVDGGGGDRFAWILWLSDRPF